MDTLVFIKDETHKRRYVQIDLDRIANANNEEIEEIIDIVIAEARKDEEKITIEELEQQLKAEGRIWRISDCLQ
jgi:hypothetical protein